MSIPSHEAEQRTPVPIIEMQAPIVPSDEIVDDLRSGFPAEQRRHPTLRRTDREIAAALDEVGISDWPRHRIRRNTHVQ